MQQLTSLQGVPLEGYHTLPFNKQILSNVDLEVYTPKRVHYLVNALVNNTKMPSEQAMLRSERKNFQKSGAEKADQVVGRLPRVSYRPRRFFQVPDRYGRKRIPKQNRGNRVERGRQPLPFQIGQLPSNIGPTGFNPTALNLGPYQFPIFSPPNMQLPPGVNFPLPVGIPQVGRLPVGIPQIGQLPIGFPTGSVLPNSTIIVPQQPASTQVQSVSQPLPQAIIQASLSAEQIVKQKMQAEKKVKLPTEIVRKMKATKSQKEQNSAFKIHSPEWNVLKAYKCQASQIIEKHREQVKKDKDPIIGENLKDPLPIYFQKKKANQKRRRQEKHELIKKHKKALAQIFGDAIFRKGWPIGRKEIKLALGIEEETNNNIEGVGEFIKMAEEKQVEQMSIEIGQLKISPASQEKEQQQ